MKFDFSGLVAQGLVVKKDIGNGLSLYKYNNKVFFDNLWHVDPLLLEARGIVLDSENNVVVWPFTKVFNHRENNTDCDMDEPIEAIRKVNGFMACATKYQGELLITTTGSSDSDFAVLASKYLEPLKHTFDSGNTYIFEICDPSDPHIVEEEAGAYLIGIRHVRDGRMFSERYMDNWVFWTNWEFEETVVDRPEVLDMKFRDLLDLVKTVDHEGFMVRDSFTGNTLMKIKSPHYLSKKALMRMGKRAVDAMYDRPDAFKQRLDEEFMLCFDWILQNYTKEQWGGLDERERRAVIERFFEGEAF